MPYNANEVYILNPAYVMKNDSRRVVIYSGFNSNRSGVGNWESFLHPLQAQIFSFFTFNRPLNVTVSQLGKYLKRDESTVRKIISPFIENPLPVYTKYRDEKVRIPKNIIVNRNQLAGEVDFLNLSPDIFECQSVDLSARRMYSGPQLLTFMLNNTCVSDCIYCYADTKTGVKKRLSTVRILELIEEAKTMQVQAINLMGGEVFLHPGWPVILKKMVDLNLSPEYLSTKIPINDEIIHSIKETGYTHPIQISLDACTSGLLQKKLSVKSDYLPKVLRGIKLLDESGLNYRISSVLTTYNTQKDIFKKLFGFISQLKNITDWRITLAVNSNWIAYDRFRQLKPGKAEIESLYEFIEKEIIPNSKIPILLNRSALNREFYTCTTGSKDFKGVKCSALNNHLFILPDGQATICEQLYWSPQFLIGDVSINTLSEVWNSPAVKKLLNLTKNDIQDNSPCKACKLFESCFSENNRCWVDIVKAYGKENWDYPDPRCTFAPPMIHDLGFGI
ncbi:radical SAM/SPASM domain-containing protein [Bacteroidia bacterium]|nr:radical SAM/SPASM domain-containing protein [Bacteroidia bacterium]